MCGALLRYITTPTKDFQPMGANRAFCPRLKRASVTNASGILPSRNGRGRHGAVSGAERKTKRLLSHQYALPYTLIIEQSAKNHESQSGGNVMNIIIDAMGGDNAPKEILLGAAAAVREYGPCRSRPWGAGGTSRPARGRTASIWRHYRGRRLRDH